MMAAAAAGDPRRLIMSIVLLAPTLSRSDTDGRYCSPDMDSLSPRTVGGIFFIRAKMGGSVLGAGRILPPTVGPMDCTGISPMAMELP